MYLPREAGMKIAAFQIFLHNFKGLVSKYFGILTKTGVLENSTDSDIDIWIMIRTTSDENLASLSSLIHRNLENSKIVFVTIEKMQEEMVSAPAHFGQDITIGFMESSLISRVLPFFSPGGNC